MPVYNGEQYLRPAIDSVLAQSFSDLELLVVDDGSTDGTAAILRSYKDPRLRVFPLAHVGIIKARNYGAAQSQADWIACLDADDISLPHRLAEQMNLLRKHRDAVFCYSDVEFIGEGAATIRRPRPPRTRALLAARFCWYCPIIASSVIFKRESFQAVGGYDPDEPYSEDFGLWGRLLELGTFAFVPRPLVQYRLHQQSVTKQKFTIQSAASERIVARHCHRFFQLEDEPSARVNRLLRTASCERKVSEWFWFLTRCVPRLRWKSPELFAWLAKETIRVLAGTKARRQSTEISTD
jgi:glycosyltransferase involved in cell wall biosynthesis